LRQAVPDVRIERSTSTAEPEAGGARIRVNALRVTGATLFSEAELVSAATVTPGSELTLSDLRKAAARVSAHYNSRGYFLAQAYLPAQDVKNGAVTIAVVEGRYGEIEVRNRTNLSVGRPARLLRGIAGGDPVASASLERRLFMLSDIPGVRVRSTLTPGAAVGTSDLIVDIDPGPESPAAWRRTTPGNRYTGALRLGGTLDLNNPAVLGDQLSLRVLASEAAWPTAASPIRRRPATASWASPTPTCAMSSAANSSGWTPMARPTS
jgi:hemolysin activation/secretion protein